MTTNTGTAIKAILAADSTITPEAAKAEVRRQTRKSDGKKTKEMQRERAAKWLKDENAAGRKASIVDAARHFGNDIQAEKIKGGYADAESLCTALCRNAEKLNIAGAGKSTFSLQCALHWVLGVPCFGIEPVRPLKIAVIQAEDDVEELAMFRANMKQGLAADGFTPERIDEALKRLHIRTDFLGKTGADFANALGAMQRQYHYDLVIVNRGILFVHHMAKPAKEKDAARLPVAAWCPAAWHEKRRGRHGSARSGADGARA